MTLEQAAQATGQPFRFYPDETIEFRREAESRKEAAVLCSLWASEIRKHFGGDFSLRMAVKGELCMYQVNFYGDDNP